MQVYDARVNKLVERVHFDASTLVSRSLGLRMNDPSAHSDSLGEVTHSVRIYKGKIFLMVSGVICLFAVSDLVIAGST